MLPYSPGGPGYWGNAAAPSLQGTSFAALLVVLCTLGVQPAVLVTKLVAIANHFMLLIQALAVAMAA